MCGITGFYQFKKGRSLDVELDIAVQRLGLRGPDASGTFWHGSVGLGHTRLSILDTSMNGNQPMHDPTGRYTLVFNGEIYNFNALRSRLPPMEYVSSSDTEVLLHLLIHEGVQCLPELNGFFAFAFYDKELETLLLARDRMGIKPLHIYQDADRLYFGSEMKAVMAFPFLRKINNEALYWYLKLNYLPADMSMLDGVRKLLPGHYLHVDAAGTKEGVYWEHKEEPTTDLPFSDAQRELVRLMDQSVQRRLIADVPLGSFLSGGTDSSVIVALASRHHQHISTFSIGYADHSFFDETKYAELVAKKFNTNHTTFSLTNDDLLHDLDAILSYIDEPFADSSAIPTYILSRHVSSHVKVALSGDGADELFGGYYKHMALKQSLDGSLTNGLLRAAHPLVKRLPQSRSGKWSNLFRRANRYSTMMRMNAHERYWFLASLTNDPSALMRSSIAADKIKQFKRRFLVENPEFNNYLLADIFVLLPGDMLTKVDLMSMANGLEVRVPFLDKDVVAFARVLPSDYKVKGNQRKRIVQDAFRELLPAELYHRPKKGFEVPLLQWMRNELLADLDQVLFSDPLLRGQGIFDGEEVMNLRRKLLSSNPGDVHGTIWALYVFQKWHNRWMS
jgi:asparagine synthase (glutamine-hydrolysing)